MAICFVVPFYSQKWEARHDGVQPQLPSAPRDSISIDDDDDDEEAMEVDSHEHDWRLAEFAPNTTLARQQATNSQLTTAGHYNSFFVWCAPALRFDFGFSCAALSSGTSTTHKKLNDLTTDEIIRMATDSFSTFNSWTPFTIVNRCKACWSTIVDSFGFLVY